MADKSFSMKFVPGSAAEKLKELAIESGQSKNAILCELIEKAKIPSSDAFRVEFRRFTGIGNSLIKTADFDRRVGIGEYALKMAKEAHMRLEISDDAPGRKDLTPAHAEMVNGSARTGMNFRPREQTGKLLALADTSGLTKQAVLRALVLGIRLPNRQRMKTYGRISQIGGLCKHLALQNIRHKDWRELFRHGSEIQAIAITGAKAEKGARR